MMKLILPDHKTEVKYGVKHLDCVEMEDVKTGDSYFSRGTRVWIKFGEDNPEIMAESVCSPNDNFSKRIGRKIAADRLLKKLPQQLSKRDKRTIFEAICPEFKSGE